MSWTHIFVNWVVKFTSVKKYSRHLYSYIENSVGDIFNDLFYN